METPKKIPISNENALSQVSDKDQKLQGPAIALIKH